MGAVGHTTPLIKKLDLDRFDLTQVQTPPPQLVMGAFGHATPPKKN